MNVGELIKRLQAFDIRMDVHIPMLAEIPQERLEVTDAVEMEDAHGVFVLLEVNP